MYNSVDIAKNIKSIAKTKNIVMTQMFKEIGLGTNTMANLKTSFPKADNIAKIADYLNCSIDELMGRQSYCNGSITATADAIGVVGNSNSSVNIDNRSETELSAQEKDFIRIYRSLTGKEQLELMSHAYELEEKEEK